VTRLFAIFALPWLIGAPQTLAQAPEISKVDPPGWWAGHSLNPVRLLIRGRGLGGAEFGVSDRSLRTSRPRVNGAGTAAFVDLWIGAGAAPGPRSLTLRTPRGSTSAPFEVLASLPREGRFKGFSQDDVIYLIMPDRFANGDPTNDDPALSRGLMDRGKTRYYHGGDIQGIIDHLPYLKDLGVTTLWLTPLYDNVNFLNARQRYDGEASTDYHGYGAVDFYTVEEHFGDVKTLRSLVDKAHALGLKVVLDQVANHTGPDHPWAKDPPTPTWWNGSEARHLVNHWQIWTLADPHATPEIQRETLEGWFVDVLPDLNQNDPEVARYLIQNTLWWIGVSGLDGIREDTLPYVPRAFWKEWRAALKREYPEVSVVGEVTDGDPALVSFFQGGLARFDGIDSGIESLFDYPLYYPLRKAFGEGRPLRDLMVMLGHDGLYVNPDHLVTFAGLHDTPRFMNEHGATTEGLELAETFLMTTRGIPMVYYGDEIGMKGGEDPDNRRDFPGGFPGDQRNAFLQEGRTPDEQKIFDHVRKLLHLRAELLPLRRGLLRELAVSDQVSVFARTLKGQTVLVALNNDTKPGVVEFPSRDAELAPGTVLEDRLGVLHPVTVAAEVRLELPARSGAILVPKR
jgi:glycosidase